jgi:hypothetical protein
VKKSCRLPDEVADNELEDFLDGSRPDNEIQLSLFPTDGAN